VDGVSTRGSASQLLALLALLLVAAGQVSCSKTCTEIGCQTQFTGVISASSASLPAGTHRIDVTADGVLLSCSFAFPLETLPSGALVGPRCSPGLMASVGPAQQCTPFTTAEAKGLRCVPIPDQIRETVQIIGTPSVIAIEQSVDGVVILQRSSSPTYVESQPNGPGCEPICHQATSEWSIP
jgi:hypothetical protein